MATIGICSSTPVLKTTVEVAAAADKAGLDAGWTGEFNDRSAIVGLAEMARHTETAGSAAPSHTPSAAHRSCWPTRPVAWTRSAAAA